MNVAVRILMENGSTQDEAERKVIELKKSIRDRIAESVMYVDDILEGTGLNASNLTDIMSFV